MPVIVDPSNGRGRLSAWEGREEDDRSEQIEYDIDGAERGTIEMRVTEAEHKLLLHLRMLERGTYNLSIRRDSVSMWGLRDFNISRVG